jgi:hypothetical protein
VCDYEGEGAITDLKYQTSSRTPTKKMNVLAALSYAVAMAVTGVLMFVHVYFLIMFADLESDFVSPIDLCQRLNVFVLPEFGAHFFVSLLVLLNLDLVATLLNGLLLAYHYHLYSRDRHWLDATTIFKDLSWKRRDSIAKLVLFMFFFFFYLYRLIMALVS